MAAKYTLNVSVTEHLSSFVAAQVASGRFGTASEVVRAGLRLLERDLHGPLLARPDGHAGPHGSEPVIAAQAKTKRIVKRGMVP
jgi:Bacterial antitoxin of ParD toxin-antitoxin type II system and RHH